MDKVPKNLDQLFSIPTLDDSVAPLQDLAVATKTDGSTVNYRNLSFGHPVVEYYRNGGILHTVVRNLAKS